MKNVFVSDILACPAGSQVEILGWVRAIRDHKSMVFIDICDSTGQIQVVVNKKLATPEMLEIVDQLLKESAVKVVGILQETPHVGKLEVLVSSFEVIAKSKALSPAPRDDIDPFDVGMADHLLRNRHLFIRNPKVMAILKYRDIVMSGVHEWFRSHRFTEITAPILTPLPLYDDGTAINLDLHGQQVFLTQCVGFYLESAVHAFERVYNIGPSFRGEESRSKRHLMEYWHIKGEMTFANLQDGIDHVEQLIRFLAQRCFDQQDGVTAWLGTPLNDDALKGPYPRTTYKEVVNLLNKHDIYFPFGKSLGQEEEAFLSRHFQSPVWVVGVPRSVEPFPYVIDPEDPMLTMTADLIASREYGELLGVAEKITDVASLHERMAEKGKQGQSQYDWFVELREVGFVPHIGFGIGVERFLRWMLLIPHVRDAIPFPRTFRRTIYP